MESVIGPVYQFIRFSGCGNSFVTLCKVYIIRAELQVQELPIPVAQGNVSHLFSGFRFQIMRKEKEMHRDF